MVGDAIVSKIKKDRKEVELEWKIQELKEIMKEKDDKFNAETVQINLATRHKTYKNRELEDLRQKHADKKKEYQEKKQVWQSKREEVSEKVAQQKIRNETVEYRIGMRKEELKSKTDLVLSLQKQIQTLQSKIQTQE